jgi:DNA invertase Pin-like site-specific DNA recombinase
MRAKATALVGVYVRVSTILQNEDGQRREIQRWLDGNGIAARQVRWYVDKESGDTLKRPEFTRLQTDVFHGDIRTVVVWKLDRLSRKIRDGINTLSDWCERGLRVVSVTQQIDFNGTMGKFLANIFFGIAEMEQELRRERQRAGIEAARAKGLYKGRKRGTTKNNPQRARQLKKQGNTLREIANAMQVSRNTVIRYLRQASETLHRKTTG